MRAQDLVDSAAAFLVDLDGTLVDSSAPVKRAWTDFARRNGLDPAEVRQFAHGRPSRETVRLLAPQSDHAEEARIVEEFEVNDAAGIRALPGAAELLASGRRLALVTSCSLALAHVRLEAAGLDLPTTIISADTIKRGKPDPECFLLGAERLGVPVAGCVVLEDAPAGVRAGTSAGAQVVALRTTHSDSDLNGADAIVDDLSQLAW